MPPREGFRYQTEFSSVAELDTVIADLDAMRIQSLLVAERILGPYHKDYVFRYRTKTNNFQKIVL